jgi:hypothetical protein
MPQAGFESPIPKREQPQTLALDRKATGIDSYISYTLLINLHKGKAKRNGDEASHLFRPFQLRNESDKIYVKDFFFQI